MTANPHLVETDWLEAHLGDPQLRIFDCTVYLPNYFEESAGTEVEILSGRDDYTVSHIPGSGFVDLIGELVAKDNDRFMFPMPPPDQFAEVMSRLGVGAGTHVVLYDRMVNMWATRVWWMLRAYGFDNAAVLNGGWTKWATEGRAVTRDSVTYAPAEFPLRPRPQLIATKSEVLNAMSDRGTCIVNALDADEYAGRGVVRYGRPGHIPSSVSVSFLEVLDQETNAYRPLEELRARFETVGALDADRVITYCGGGIAATSAAFLLTLLGAQRVAVYDGSMTEWAADATLPLKSGEVP